jgi:uncharacterized protein (DUF302 family)
VSADPSIAVKQADAGVAMPRSGDTRSHQSAEANELLVVTKSSPWSMADTVARLSAVVAARGMKVFAVIDHSDEARRVGLALRDTKLFIVGSPTDSTPAIAAAPLAALDLPLRVVVWEDGYQTKVSYPSPAEVARRYGLDDDLAAALESIDAVISAVVDR